MGHGNGRIWKPISWWDAAHTIGINTLDEGVICRSGWIEKWAKYKPVRHSTPIELTEAERAAANYGMQPKASAIATTSPYELYSAYNGDMNGWEYLQPRGVSGNIVEWYRVLDFDGYTHNPVKPIRNYAAAASVQVETLPTTFVAASFIGMTDPNGASIELSDIIKILSDNSSQPENIYFGVALFQGTGTPTGDTLVEIATSNVPISKNQQGTYAGCGVTFNKPNASHKGYWTAVPFFTKTQISQRGIWEMTSLVSAKYYTIPYAGVSAVYLFDNTDKYTIDFDAVCNLSVLFLTITFTSKTNEPITLSATVYYWDARDTRRPDQGAALQGEEKAVSNTFTIPANGTYTWRLSNYSPSTDFANNAIGYLQVGGNPAIRFTFDRTPQPDEQ